MRNVTAAAALVYAALLAACSASPGDFSTSLGAVVHSDSATEVNLAKILPLQWDELYAFGPYSIRDRSCETLQLGWLACRTTIPSSIDEHEFFLVFRNRSAIVHTEHHWRWNGDFSSSVSRPHPILHSSARFEIKLVSNRAPEGERWYQLEHVSSVPAQTQ
jgi:hypothetical protein